MKFQDYEYTRVNVEETRLKIQGILQNLEGAEGYEEFLAAFQGANTVLSHADTMSTLNHIRFTIDTKNEFYSSENDFWNEQGPLFEEMKTNVFKAVTASPFKEELKKDVPYTYFLLGENALRSFDEKIIGDLQEENRLTSAYQKIIAGAEIQIGGKTYTLASLGGLMNDPAESVRKEAYLAYWKYMEDHEAEIDDVYDKLVKLRDSIAKNLGFQNFVELGYLRKDRLDYNQEDVANYRRQVLTDVVPVANKLYEAQKKRLGVDTLEVYNEDFQFASGNPTPKHDKDTMVEIAQKMYREMSPETGVFFDHMIESDLLDLESKPGKAAGGYCTFLADYKTPFIFSNFNGTQHDVDVLTHEAGHAFQGWESREIRPTECVYPTSESAEIHSMGMEFFAWPWMEQFFGEDIEKYYYSHLGHAVRFLPYGVLVDHFQHEVYSKPEMTSAERKEVWRDLEKQYLPHKNYEAIPMLEKGTWWLKQLHIFLYPFYYIDYTLAQVCALQFWLRLQEKDPTAFADYLRICKIGGSETFTKIVKAADLKSPFEEGCLTDVMKLVDDYLSNSSAGQIA